MSEGTHFIEVRYIILNATMVPRAISFRFVSFELPIFTFLITALGVHESPQRRRPGTTRFAQPSNVHLRRPFPATPDNPDHAHAARSATRLTRTPPPPAHPYSPPHATYSSCRRRPRTHGTSTPPEPRAHVTYLQLTTQSRVSCTRYNTHPRASK